MSRSRIYHSPCKKSSSRSVTRGIIKFVYACNAVERMLWRIVTDVLVIEEAMGKFR